MGKLANSSIAVGSINYYNLYGKQFGNIYKIINLQALAEELSWFEQRLDIPRFNPQSGNIQKPTSDA